MDVIKQRRDVVFLLLAAGWMMAFSLRYPAETAAMVVKALSLSAKSVVPSLFIFTVSARILVGADISRLMTKLPLSALRRLFGVSGAGLSAVIIGLFAGFPVGASVLSAQVQRGEMEREEAESLMPFCNGASASFVIGTVGGVFFGSVRAGILLFFSQTAATLFALMLTAGSRRHRLPCAVITSGKPVSFFSVLADAIREGAAAMVSITGFITFFSVLSGSVSYLFHGKNGIFCAILSSFLEISGGLSVLTALTDVSFSLRMGLAGAFLGLGGVSVMMQAADRGEAAGLSMKKYPMGKLLCALLCGIFATLLGYQGLCP